MERGYVPEDRDALMALRRIDLVTLVDDQYSRWPKPDLGNHIAKADICDELINPRNGFTTTWPIPPSASASGSTTAQSQNSKSSAASAPFITLTFVPGVERSFDVFMFDSRTCAPRFQTVQRVQTEVADTLTCKPGEWRVSAMHLFLQIQSSNAALTGGFVRIGFPFEGDQTFTVWFLRGDVRLLMFSTPQPDRLKVSANRTLVLRIDNGNLSDEPETPPPPSKRPRLSSPPQSPPSPSPLPTPPSAVVSTSSSRRPAAPSIPGSPLEDDSSWLQNIVASRPGYTLFVSGRGKVLQNPSIVHQWKFATEFAKEYHRRLAPSGRAITKSLIHQVLGIKDTWLTQAEEGARLVAVYGEGGSHSAAAVVLELATRREPSNGATKLLKYLQDYGCAHPAESTSPSN